MNTVDEHDDTSTIQIHLTKGWEIDSSDLTVNLDKILGHGSFGIVYLGQYHNMNVAVKSIAASSQKEKALAVTMLNREIKTLSRCHHQNIVRLVGACLNPPQLVLAYASKGTLHDLLQDTQLLPSRKFELVNGICDGMTVLHSSGILHLDLKPRNVLISENGIPWVTDFGLAIVTSTLTCGGSTKSRGTMQYKAPEHFIDDSDDDSDNDSNDNETKVSNKSTYDKSADVYSFGIMCWEIFSGDIPFAGKTDGKIVAMHIKAAMDKKKIKRPPLDQIPPEVVSFIKACWAQDPSARPTFEEAKLLLDAVSILNVPGALNAPGHWDVIISHTQRHGKAVAMAEKLAASLEKLGLTVWLDVNMTQRSAAAMQEGVRNSKCVIAIITGACVDNNNRNTKEIENAYFSRPFCISELEWAIEAGIQIQPIIQMEDKNEIGTFLNQAPAHLKFIGNIDFIDMNRGDIDYWEVGVKKIIKAMKNGKELSNDMKKMYETSRNELSSSSTASNEYETKTNAIDTYDLFLSHKQNDINPDLKVRIKDLARTLNEHFTGRGLRCFLDKNFNGNSWNDLPNLVACSQTFLVVLSENFVESPWCVLELLSAVMHRRPIAFLKVSNAFKLAALKKQLIEIGFPYVDALDQFSVEINYSEDHFDSAMNDIAERVKSNDKEYPMSVDVVTRDQVAEKYEELREARNERFPEKRSFPSWGTDQSMLSTNSNGETKESPVVNPNGVLLVQPDLDSLVTAVKETNEKAALLRVLRVQPGLNSLSKAVEEAKEQGIGSLLLLKGVHDEEGENVTIDFALKVVGQNKDDVKIRAGLMIKGKEEEDVFFTDCTVTGAKNTGVFGNKGAAMHLKNVCVENCGKSGVFVKSTKRNTMTDCNVNNNKWSGVYVQYGGRMVIDGSATTIHHNVTGGDSRNYGLHAYFTDSNIHLKSPLTKESISTNNGGGCNYGGIGTIKTIETVKEDTDTTTEERKENATSSGETKTYSVSSS
jgi:parallel beta-helix repeat protein